MHLRTVAGVCLTQQVRPGFSLGRPLRQLVLQAFQVGEFKPLLPGWRTRYVQDMRAAIGCHTFPAINQQTIERLEPVFERHAQRFNGRIAEVITHHQFMS
ncbi:hypothetical protein D3C78_1320710 [compost metagenome]